MLNFKKVLKKNKSLIYLPLKLTFNQLAISYVSIGADIKHYCSLFSNFIYAQRKGILILDLRITIFELKKVTIFLQRLILSRGKIFFVDYFYNETYNAFLNSFIRLQQYSFNSKWKGGFLSNFKYLYFELIKIKVFKNFACQFDGLFNMCRIPNLIITPCVKRNLWAIKESSMLRLPNITLNNGNVFFNFSLIFVPGNSDHFESLKTFIEICLMSIINGYIQEILIFKDVKKIKRMILYRKYLKEKLRIKKKQGKKKMYHYKF